MNDMVADPRSTLLEGTEEEQQASILVPLTVDGTVIGVLALDRSEGRTFEQAELEPAQKDAISHRGAAIRALAAWLAAGRP